MSVAVRLATGADAAELARLRWEYRLEEERIATEVLEPVRREFVEAAEAWLRDALGGGRWTVAVGAEGDRLCGCLFLERVDKVPDPGAIERAWGYLTNAYVAPEHRGRGIGGKLLERLVQVARTDALEFLIVWPSPEAVSFYERVGFIATAARHAGPDDHGPLELTVAG